MGEGKGPLGSDHTGDMRMNMIAPYILESEYRCPDCNGLPPDLETKRAIYDIFFAKFKEIREAWGKPINISSGYRCKKRNLAEGGKETSAHLFGLALDMNFPTVGQVYEMEDLIEDLHPDLRRGIYTQTYTFVHIDAAWLIVPRISLDWSKGVRWSD